ncbi:hypothetical protein D9M70_606330 [compost metagenome]
MTKGSIQPRALASGLRPIPVKSTPARPSSSARAGSTRLVAKWVRPWIGSFKVPVMR